MIGRTTTTTTEAAAIIDQLRSCKPGNRREIRGCIDAAIASAESGDWISAERHADDAFDIYFDVPIQVGNAVIAC